MTTDLDMREKWLEARMSALEAELPVLRAENRRLREALQKIADITPNDLSEACKAARAALEAKP